MDTHWLAQEAQHIHTVFSNLFYSIVVTLLIFGVLLNYFKMPLGQVPEFFHLVGRALIAAFLLVAFPEIMNALSDLTDQLSKDLGQLHNFKLVVARLGEKIGTLTWSWVSVKDSVLILISYITFFLVYVTVYLADSLFLFTWTLLFIFSPVLIAAFVLPATSTATKGLFKSLVEVCLWKVIWSVLAALLWSYALSEINNPHYEVDFITAIVLNLILAFSVVITPMIVSGLVNGSIHHVSASLGGAVLGAAALTPMQMAGTAGRMVKRPIHRFRERRMNLKTSEDQKDSPMNRAFPKRPVK